MMTIKERISALQEGIINKVGKGSIEEQDKVKIKAITNSVAKWSFLIFESIGMTIIFLYILPKSKGWDFSQTSILLSILFVLTIPLLSKKSKSL